MVKFVIKKGSDIQSAKVTEIQAQRMQHLYKQLGYKVLIVRG